MLPNLPKLKKDSYIGMLDNPAPTYRGYRKQALYGLWRVLTDPGRDSQSYRPEGEEDLAIFDSAGYLLEAIQVKDYSNPLTLSDFKPQSRDGFFARMKQRQVDHPSCRHSLVSFGPLGPELDGALRNLRGNRESVARKLSEKNPSISLSDAAELLEALHENVSHPDESRIRADILTAITNTIAGIHGIVALDLLTYWIFEASEQRRTITRSGLLQQLQRIGNYLAALRDHTNEWMISLRPLEQIELTDEESRRLRNEYRRGTQATWNHIVADADCPRPRPLSELHEKISKHNAVIIRGASGQGKSSLAFRYLHDYCAQGLRFHVSFVEGREHGLRIANALRGHVEQLHLRAVVLLDLGPSDYGWADLVHGMVDAGLKVLVTVREEDFRRSETFTSSIDYAELSLDSITREEAESIYNTLASRRHYGNTIDFEDAWLRFSSADSSPLLEFTHLVSEGETLQRKIDSQITRLQREAVLGASTSGFTNSHLRLLTIATIANSFECRVNMAALCKSVGIDPLTRPLQLIENEYLIRRHGTGSGSTIIGLHPLRSQAVENALLHDCPEMWGELAIQCLPLVIDEDIERFLLCSFSRRNLHSHKLEIALHYLPPRTWTHAGGVARALLWEGINRYEQENHEIIAAAIAEHFTSWWLICNAFVGSESKLAEDLRVQLTNIFGKELPRTQLSAKEKVFDPFRQWAACVQPPPCDPANSSDWISAGDLAFWLGNKEINVELTCALQKLLPEPIPDYFAITELSRFISGRYALADTAFFEWHNRNKGELIERFIVETKSAYVADNGEQIKLFFPVLMAGSDSNTDSRANSFHEQAIRRIQLLRALFPMRSKYGSKGLGMELLATFLPHDETEKDIPAENLPIVNSAQLNGIFFNLVSYRLQRAASWREYAERAYQIRRGICDCFKDLQRSWGQFLREPEIKAKTIRQFPEVGLNRIKQSAGLPMYPQSVVDEWGFISETQDKMKPLEGSNLEARNYLQRFDKWKKSWNDYESGVGQVAIRAVEETLRRVHLAKANDSQSVSSSCHLLLTNLNSSWSALCTMQTEFRRWFSRYISADKLVALETHECGTFYHLWAVAYSFVNEPLSRVLDPLFLEGQIKHKRWQFLNGLIQRLTYVMSEGGSVKISEGPHLVNEKQCLVVVCDHASLNSIAAKLGEVVSAIWQTSQSVGWRNMEWTPLIIEWPYIFVTHTLRGRGLYPGGTHLSSFVLFGTESEFEVKNHHIIGLSVSMRDYRALGLELWDSPLLSAVQKFQEDVVSFIFTLSRYYSFYSLATEYGLTDAALKSCIETFSQETSNIRRSAQVSFEDLRNLMMLQIKTSPTGEDTLLSRIENLYKETLLVRDSEQSAITITLERFMDWSAHLASSMEEAKILFGEITESAVQN